MIGRQEIKEMARRLGRATNAHRVILFGSYARGNPTVDSDVDFMIIAESNLPRFKRSRKLYGMIKPYPFPMDLLVYTPDEVERAKRSTVSFVSQVLQEGKTLYVAGARAGRVLR